LFQPITGINYVMAIQPSVAVSEDQNLSTAPHGPDAEEIPPLVGMSILEKVTKINSY
jgi:hypothetical protein